MREGAIIPLNLLRGYMDAFAFLFLKVKFLANIWFLLYHNDMKQEDWKSTGNAVYLTWYHFVWSVKYRRKVLVGAVADTTKEVIADLCNKQGFEIRAIEVMPDHVHLFVSAPPKIPLTQVAKAIKGGSARAIFTRHPELRKQLWKGHLWNPSYFVGTAGNVSAETIQKYIEDQTLKEADE